MSGGVRRGIGVAVLLMVLVGGGLFWPRLELDASLAALLPVGDPEVASHLEAAETLGALDRVFADVVAVDGPVEAAVLEEVADRLGEAWRASGLFDRVHVRFTLEDVATFADLVASHRAVFMDAERMAALARETDGEGAVRDRLKELHRQLLSPAGFGAAAMRREDPLGWDRALVEELLATGVSASDVDLSTGYMASADGRRLLVTGWPDFPVGDPARSLELVGVLDAAREEALRLPGAEGVRINYCSGYISAHDNATTLRGDIQRALTVVTVCIALLGVFVFRRLHHALLIFVPPLFGLSVVVVLWGVLGRPLSAVAAGCGAALVGVTVDYAFHVIFQLEASPGHAVRAVVRPLRLPIAAGAVTTSAALLCLLLTDLPAQRDMGAVAAVGVAAALAGAVLVLPALLFQGRTGRPAPALPRALEGLFRTLGRRFNYVGVAGLALLLLLAAGVPRLRYDEDLTRLNYLTPPRAAEEQAFMAAWGKMAPSVAIAHGMDLEEALRRNEAVHAVLEDLRRRGLLETFRSIAPFVPSRRTQDRNLERWTAHWTRKRVADLERRLQREGAELSFREDAFSPFIEKLGAPAPRLDPAAVGRTAIGSMAAPGLAEGAGPVRLPAYFTVSDARHYATVARELRAIDGVTVADKGRFARRIGQLAASGMARLAVVAPVVVFVVLALLFGSGALALAAFLPMALGLLATLGLLGWTGTPVNVVSSVFVVFVCGIGVDTSVFLANAFLERFRTGRDTCHATMVAVTLCASTTLAGFGAMLLSRHPALHGIGVTGFAGITASLLAGLVCVPVACAAFLPFRGRWGGVTIPQLARGLSIVLGIYLVSITYVLLWKPLVAFRHRGGWTPERRGALARCYLRGIARAFVWVFSPRGSGCRRVGVDRLREAGGRVVVCNHLSNLDTQLLLGQTENLVMIMNERTSRVRFMGRMLRDAEFIVAGADDYEVLLGKCRGLLARGISVLFFPEGTRSRSGRMKRFRRGAFQVAVDTSSPVLPVLLTGTDTCLSPEAFWIRHYQATVRVLPEASPEGLAGEEGARTLMRRVRGDMVGHLAGDWRETHLAGQPERTVAGFYTHLLRRGPSRVARLLRREAGVCRYLDQLLPLDAAVADLTCGWGAMANYLGWAALDRRVVGHDGDRQRVRVASASAWLQRNTSFVPSLQDVEKDGPFDYVLIDSMQLRMGAAPDTWVQTASGVLCPGGRALVRVREGYGQWETAARVAGLRLDPKVTDGGAHGFLAFVKEGA